MKKSFIFKLQIILIIILVLCKGSNASASDLSNKPIQSVEAKVIQLLPNTDNSNNNISNKIKVEIISGKHKGQILTVDNMVDSSDNDVNTIETFNVHKGDEVLINIEENNDGSIKSANIYDFVRYKYLAAVAFLFILLLLGIGGKKGFKSLITLLLTGLAIIKIIIPVIMKGMNPIIPTILVCIGLILINITIINGINKKTLSAVIGTTLGLLSSGILVLTLGNMIRLTGINVDDAQTLTSLPINHPIHFKELLFVGILLGALGAVMDIGITISSALYEIQNANPNVSRKELIKSGMNVGKDILGAMANTLILAYVSGSLVIIIILSSFNLSFIEILNQDIIASEIFKSLVGSIGLTLTIPATVFTAALLSKYKTKIK